MIIYGKDEMKSRRTCSIAAVIILLLAAAPPVHALAPLAHSASSGIRSPLAPLGTLRSAGGTWTNQAPALPSARSGHAMAYLGGDQVLLFGGSPDYVNVLGDTWVYDLSDESWSNTEPATGPPERRSHATAWIGGDQVLLFGGRDGSSFDLGDTWVYDLSDNTWTNMAPATGPSPRVGHAMAWLGGDQVFLFGGYHGSYFGDTWVYDLSDNSWTNKNPAAAPTERFGHAMAWLGGDQVLLFGGYDGYNRFGDTWVYDLSDNGWTNKNAAAAPTARFGHAMASLGGDQVLLFGGWDGALNGETWLARGFFTDWRRVYLPVVMRKW